jgi:hypothetical protein
MKPSNFSTVEPGTKGKSGMIRIIQLVCAILMLAASMRCAFGFALIGPPETFQTSANGWDRVQELITPLTTYQLLEVDFNSTPKNISEGYRWSVPVLYYTYDATFLDYFGSNGVQAVDSAVGVLNALPKASQMDINDFPLDEARVNYTAAALHLFDVKSATLEMLISRLGLADPERSVWAIRDRRLQPTLNCPFYNYVVIGRNFDPDTLQPSRYVNGNLFTYSIIQTCPPAPDRADAAEILVDPIDMYLSALATPKVTVNYQSAYGLFHIGLTRDDAAALKYLYSPNNMNLEIAAADVQLFQTNVDLQPLFTSNLTLFAAQASTNSAAAMQALYPNLVINSTTVTGFSNLFATNIVGFLTNQPWAPAGTFQIAFRTNVVFAGLQTNFVHTFANIFTFQPNGSGGWTAIPLFTTSQANGVQIFANQTSSVVITNPPFGLPGTNFIATNITTRLRIQKGPVGEYAILPTNFCSLSIAFAQFTNVVPETNIIASFTNTVATTNLIPGQVLQATLSVVDFFTNHIFAYHPISCTFSNVSERQGLDKISFVRHDFDPLLSRFFSPVTNDFDVVAQTTNNIRYVEHYRRIVTRPDILIAAGDGNLTSLGNAAIETVDHSGASAPIFTTNTIPPNPIPPAGPGTLEVQAGTPVGMVLTFNKVGPTYLNSATSFLDENNNIFYYQWASFDGSTNAPILYPSSASLAGLQQQSFIQVSPSFLPAGAFRTAYSASLSVSGGTAPYTWTLTPNSSPMPPGLSLTRDPTDSSQATISGTPGVPGNYIFVVRVTDSGGLFVDTAYNIIISQP